MLAIYPFAATKKMLCVSLMICILLNASLAAEIVPPTAGKEEIAAAVTPGGSILTDKELIVRQLAGSGSSQSGLSIEAFKKAYAGDPQYGAAIKQIADTCLYKADQAARAKELYAAIVKAPSLEDRIGAYAGLSMAHAKMGDAAGAESAIKELKANYSGTPGYGIAVKEVADYYLYRINNADRAKRLYEDILASKADTKNQLWAWRGLVISNHQLGNVSAADAACEKLLAEDKATPSMGLAFKEAADSYFYTAKNNEKALQLYAAALRSGMHEDHTLWALRRQGVCSLQMGDKPAAEAISEKIRSGFKGHPAKGGALKEIADTYYSARDFEKAGQLYREAIDAGIDKKDLSWAYRGLAVAGFRKGRTAEAEAACEKLIRECGRESSVGSALKEIGDACFYQTHDVERAGRFYQAILDTGVKSGTDLWAWRGLALCRIDQGHHAQAREAADTLLYDYADNAKCPDAVKEVIDHYCVKGQAEAALELSENLLRRITTRPARMLGLGGVAQAYALQGRDGEVEKIVAVILNEYREEKKAAYTVFVIGEAYYLRASCLMEAADGRETEAVLKKAVSVWDHNLTQWPGSEHQAHALYYSAEALRRMGATEQAVDYYQRLVSQQPDYEKAWYAQLMIAQCRRELAGQGKVSIEDVKAAYRVLIDKYPDSPGALTAGVEMKML